MYKNSKKQGDSGLGKAISYFTELGYNVAIPLTDSADWDLIVEIDKVLKKVQVKTSIQISEYNVEMFSLAVLGGNRSWKNTVKSPIDQDWDLIFLYHLKTKRMALIPKEEIKNNYRTINLGKKYEKFIITWVPFPPEHCKCSV